MKYRFFSISRLILLTIGFSLNCSTPIFAEPPNLSVVKNELVHYHDSGLYQQELTDKIKEAQQFIIKQAIANKLNTPHQKLALVLDIDETSLSNYNKMVKRDFHANHDQIRQEILKANSPVIEPMLALYQEAKKHGVNVFFVTGRDESERDATEKNLLKAGYTNWSGLYFRPPNYKAPSIIPFKSKAREMISKKGYTIIASIGDQYSDIRGGYTKKGFKLPNPYYFLP